LQHDYEYQSPHDNSSSRYASDQRSRNPQRDPSYGASRGASRCASPESSRGPSRNSSKPRFTAEQEKARQQMQVCTNRDRTTGDFYCHFQVCERGHHGPFMDPNGFAMVRGKDRGCIAPPALHTMPRDKATVPEVPGDETDSLLLAASVQLEELRLGIP
jgi:hypothetical protein